MSYYISVYIWFNLSIIQKNYEQNGKCSLKKENSQNDKNKIKIYFVEKKN